MTMITDGVCNDWVTYPTAWTRGWQKLDQLGNVCVVYMAVAATKTMQKTLTRGFLPAHELIHVCNLRTDSRQAYTWSDSWGGQLKFRIIEHDIDFFISHLGYRATNYPVPYNATIFQIVVAKVQIVIKIITWQLLMKIKLTIPVLK